MSALRINNIRITPASPPTSLPTSRCCTAPAFARRAPELLRQVTSDNMADIASGPEFAARILSQADDVTLIAHFDAEATSGEFRPCGRRESYATVAMAALFEAHPDPEFTGVLELELGLALFPAEIDEGIGW